MTAQELSDTFEYPRTRTFASDIYVAVSSPEESHLQALLEPDLNLSAHPAPIIQPTAKSPSASAQTVAARGVRSDLTSIPHGVYGD